ncbi:unnamed protein product [Phytomonas sp. EM1]|nr:unnamed protein product [Phytomonas sp. EM1]|eukprot:CCW63745.1 unnamed protein product [Phytomonas sp. isolate EM1]
MSSPTESTSGGTWSSNEHNSKNRRRNKKLKKRSPELSASNNSLSGDASNSAVGRATPPPPSKEAPFVYTHPKPQVITGALFMWEGVASFCEPSQVCELERLSKDVAAHLAESNTSNRLMQRYWNAQWSRLIWDDDLISHEKRFILPSSLPRSKGRVNWKKCFVEEYPLWLQRTIMGKGKNDRDYDVSKVLFRREMLNAHLSAEELAAMELTVEEAMHKAMSKRGIEVSNNGEVDPKYLLEDQKYVKKSLKRRGEGGSNGTASPLLGKGRSCLNLCDRPSQESLTREDYQFDHRQGSRKGKHKKGMEHKWSSFDNFGDYDY